ncbi:YqaA family protein [Marinospirillum perlucidum]|uniref:YqaA family protein n=1 Tax=Marinospirillum perlucidum TaxID=1982602 RepID=UPI000DF3D432|nr:YqaA family protein [Marinospirillum perlucidum]
MSLFWVFITGLVSATLFPGGSEALVVAQVCREQPLLLLWLLATSGNTLGSWINWLLGRYLLHFENRRWFPIKPHQRLKAEAWFQRWGFWSLLFAWLPVVGDPLTLVAGTLRVHWLKFLLLVATGKGLRYALLIAAARLAGC